jgi:UDP-2-acetamido-3-amino-2,3-dideoxy-glucuronate N-acetyltransferase
MSANIAVIGTGAWGRNLVRNFYQLGALRVVCDVDQTCGASVRALYPDVEVSTDFCAVVKDAAIHGIVLATPAALHARMAQEALEAGKDVFVEKPLALTTRDGERLVGLAARSNRILMVGHILQYHPAVVKLKQLVATGELGQIRYVYSNRLNIGKIRVEENILWSFAPHDISVILALLGEQPAEVTCQGGGYLNHGIADVTLSEFVFPSGVRAHIFVSWLHPFKEQRLVVVGSEKMAVFDDTASNKLVVYPHRVEWRNRIPTAVKEEGIAIELVEGEPLRLECQHFLDSITLRRRPLTDGNEGLGVLRVVEACHLALSEHRAVSITLQEQKQHFVHETAVVDSSCEIGAGTKIWHFSHILKGAQIGKNCIFGQNCSVAGGVVIGDNVKVQNNVSIYTGTEIEDDVFLGPSCVLTNVTNPRSQVNRHSLYEKTVIRRGATVGANATIVCGVELGRYSFVGAGAVVVKSVPDYALVVGNPARQAGWMSRHGHRLIDPDSDGMMVCPESGYRYREVQPGLLRCIDLDEDDPLPQALSHGARSYEDFKTHHNAGCLAAE